MLVSIVITNHNYGRYLAQAIDSALHQTHPKVEVIVVDDGSTDDSRRIIDGYGDRVRPLFQPQRGQSAASNAGFAESRGDVVIFLDADDALLPESAALHAERLAGGRAVKSCGYMDVMEADGRPTGRQAPRKLPPSGDYLSETLTRGIDTYEVSYTSAHAWSRKFLERVLPLPEDGVLGLDGYLTAVDRLFGPVEFVHQPVARYRRHDHNKGPDGFRFEPSHLEKRLDRKYARIDYAESWIRALGYEADWDQFRRLRDWRLALMQHVLMLWGHQHDSLPFLEFVASPFQRHRPSMATSVLVSMSLAAVRAAPRPLAIRIARELLLRSQQRRATFTESEQHGWRAAGAR